MPERVRENWYIDCWAFHQCFHIVAHLGIAGKLETSTSFLHPLLTKKKLDQTSLSLFYEDLVFICHYMAIHSTVSITSFYVFYDNNI